MKIQRLKDGRLRDASTGRILKDADIDVKKRYESKMKAEYGAPVVVKQNGSNVDVYFDTKRSSGEISFGPKNYKSEKPYIQANKIYIGLKKKIRYGNIKVWRLLKEGKFPNGVAAWHGSFVLA